MRLAVRPGRPPGPGRNTTLVEKRDLRKSGNLENAFVSPLAVLELRIFALHNGNFLLPLLFRPVSKEQLAFFEFLVLVVDNRFWMV